MKTNKKRKPAADERNELHGKMSPTQQLAQLDQRLGAGVGAKKERARLQAKIQPK